MSTDRWAGQGMDITTYAGPELPGQDVTRRRVQISAVCGAVRTWVNMDLDQWAELCRATAQLGPGFEGKQ